MIKIAFELTSEQESLVKRLASWYRSDTGSQWFAYSGAAGTGKTTVIKAAIAELGISRVVACAYVGKAVTVLAKHGLEASTIHGLIYSIEWVPMEKNGEPVYKEDGSQKMRISFVRKPSLPSNPELIIVDEATMVNDDLCEDILSFGIKTVFIGDMNQLPPVFGISSIMMRPNFTLTKIMRQAEDDPIVYLSQRILNRERIEYGQYGASAVVPYRYLGDNYTNYDVILAGKNKLRDDINNHIRNDVLGFRSRTPVIGDRLICRQNNWDRCVDGNIYLTTGMSGVVTDINRSNCKAGSCNIDFAPDVTKDEFRNINLDTKFITMPYEERKEYGFSAANKFEYGYSITVHMSQGSEYDKVLFIDSWFFDAEMTKKIRYTAITRARTAIEIAGEVRFY